jgi:glycogen operon protein
MLCAGDEMGHTQWGNNNPYCQDNTTTWIDWSASDTDLLAFTARVIALRHQVMPFANLWYKGAADVRGVYDLSWLNTDASTLQAHDWDEPTQRALACLIGKPGRSTSPLLFLINASTQVQDFALPRGKWQALLDTSQAQGDSNLTGASGMRIPVSAHSLLLLQQTVGK